MKHECPKPVSLTSDKEVILVHAPHGWDKVGHVQNLCLAMSCVIWGSAWVTVQSTKKQNLPNFPRLEPKPLEIENCMLNRKIALRPPEKKNIFSYVDIWIPVVLSISRNSPGEEKIYIFFNEPQAPLLEESVHVRDSSLIYLFVVVAFSSLARIWGECSTIYSPPAFFFYEVEIQPRLPRSSRQSDHTKTFWRS